MNPEHENTYVLFPLGDTRFAVPAEMVTELARPDTLQTFPHRTPMMAGVLLRRGRIIPVFDVAQILIGPGAPPGRFYLIARCQLASRLEWTAIPVTGECELASMKRMRPSEKQPPYVSGVLQAGDKTVPIVDLEKLLSMEAQQ
jgi:chemotaxis signal transduction protein